METKKANPDPAKDELIILINKKLDQAADLAEKIKAHHLDGNDLSVIYLTIHVLANSARHIDESMFEMLGGMIIPPEVVRTNAVNNAFVEALESLKKKTPETPASDLN